MVRAFGNDLFLATSLLDNILNSENSKKNFAKINVFHPYFLETKNIGITEKS